MPETQSAETKLQAYAVGTRVRWRQFDTYGHIVESNVMQAGHAGYAVQSETNGDFSWASHDSIEPVSPAAAVSDRLFETGCCLCGADRYSARDAALGIKAAGPHIGAKFCEACVMRYRGCDAEITRRRSLAEPGFKVGDLVHRDAEDGGYDGVIVQLNSTPTDHKVKSTHGLTCQAPIVKLRLIRRAPTEAARTGEAWEPKVGDRVTGKWVGEKGDDTITGNIRSFEKSRDSIDCAVVWPNAGAGYFCSLESLRPLPPATAGGEPMCPGDGGYACSCEKCSKSRVTPPKPKTGYPNVGFVPFDQRASGIDAAIRVSKLEQAKALLARPVRTGPLRDRDKYGQKVSLRGWETDDE